MISHSHPGKTLSLHLLNVAEESKRKVSEKNLNFIWSKKKIEELAHLVGLFHDFGKFSKYFQEYLNEKDEHKKVEIKLKRETNHSLISALFTYFSLSRMGFENKLCIIGYFIVKKHHGNLSTLQKEMVLKPEDIEIIKRQIKSIDEKEVNDFYNFIPNFKLNQFLKFIQNTDLRLDFADLFDEMESLSKPDYFLLNSILYSILIDSDKKDASITEEYKRLELQSKLVDTYRSKKFDLNSKDSLNVLRNEIYNKINLDPCINIKDKIVSITAPTGTGKTLCSLSYALKLRDKLDNCPRIIYCLPFTSIIDQNYVVIKDVLNETVKDYKENASRYIIKHHHLSEMGFIAEDEKKSVEDSLMYIESWNSEVIVTTFVQLFGTLLGGKNRSLKKFHNIANSIIILDEVQNIPLKYWDIVNKVFMALAEKLDCRIILLTATKPLIFQENECKELLIQNNDDLKKYFEHKNLNRTKIINKTSYNLTINEFLKNINIKKIMDKYNSIMFVFNTIQSSLDFYNQLKEKNYTVVYLSTNIVPKKRREVINMCAKEIEKNNKFILICTQVIEAGVDLDFDIVFRDLAPVDSIIQVAGRCNRNSRKEQGKVYLYQLTDNKRRPYANSIYSHLILTAKEILDDFNEIEEKDYFKLINKYFENTRERSSQDDSKKLFQCMLNLKYKDYKESNKINSLADFALIKELPNVVDVFVEIDKNAQKIWEKFKDLKKVKSLIERKKKFLEFKNEFRDYIISLDRRFLQGLEPFENNLYYIPKNILAHNYDSESGFIRGDNESIFI